MSKDAQHLDDRDALKRRLILALQRRSTRLRTGDDPRVVPAITIAHWLKIKPNAKHETRRRRVRWRGPRSCAARFSRLRGCRAQCRSSTTCPRCWRGGLKEPRDRQ